MLQQTRVETAIPFYERFLERFPAVEALAAADEASVLAAWSGLGYYRRARALREAARAIVERHGGRFPSEVGELLHLPGVGPYTAGAVASIAFGRQEALVDGNVERVLARVFALDGGGKERTWSLARSLVPAEDPGDWNQALMELGALVCTPREPRCGRCPIARDCIARKEGRVVELTPPRLRPKPIAVDVVVLAASHRGRWLLERRPTTGRMAGMWQMPTFENGKGLLFPARRPRGLREREVLCEVRHTITRHRIRAVVKRADLVAGSLPSGASWVEAERVPGIALTGMTRKCLSAILAARADRPPDWRSRSTRNRASR